MGGFDPDGRGGLDTEVNELASDIGFIAAMVIMVWCFIEWMEW
jgi:hypothetical protein